MSFPNIILRGCIRCDDALKFVKGLLKEDWRNDRRDEEINIQSSRQAKIIRWSWGVQINCHPYRGLDTTWWDDLLKTFSGTQRFSLDLEPSSPKETMPPIKNNVRIDSSNNYSEPSVPLRHPSGNPGSPFSPPTRGRSGVEPPADGLSNIIITENNNLSKIDKTTEPSVPLRHPLLEDSCSKKESINLKKFIIILHNVDSLDSDIQKCLRRHAEDDYRTIRYIFTCNRDCILEPSLESRSVCLVKKDAIQPMPPKMKEWQDILNMWLSDIPGYRILDKIFLDRIELLKDCKILTKELEKNMISKWCEYADMMKMCYHELTILEAAWKYIKNNYTIKIGGFEHNSISSAPIKEDLSPTDLAKGPKMRGSKALLNIVYDNKVMASKI
jgi:hypothetical protein